MPKPLNQYRNRRSLVFSYVAKALASADAEGSVPAWKRILAKSCLAVAKPIFHVIFGKDMWRFNLAVFHRTIDGVPLLKMQVGERGIWELYFCSIDELYSLRDVLKELDEPPRVIADLGCGLGRSTVFLRQMMGWYDSRSLLLDGTSEPETAKPRKLGKYQTGFHDDVRLNESVYNSLPLTAEFLRSNGIQDFAARTLDTLALQEPNEAGQIDLLFSFQAVGYHWDIQSVLRELNLLPRVRKDGMLIFGIRNRDKAVSQGLPYVTPAIPGLKLTHVIEGFHRQDFLVYRRV